MMMKMLVLATIVAATSAVHSGSSGSSGSGMVSHLPSLNFDELIIGDLDIEEYDDTLVFTQLTFDYAVACDAHFNEAAHNNAVYDSIFANGGFSDSGVNIVAITSDCVDDTGSSRLRRSGSTVTTEILVAFDSSLDDDGTIETTVDSIEADFQGFTIDARGATATFVGTTEIDYATLETALSSNAKVFFVDSCVCTAKAGKAAKGMGKSAKAAKGSGKSAKAAKGSGKSAKAAKGSGKSAKAAKGSGKSAKAARGSGKSAKAAKGSGKSAKAAKGSGKSAKAAKGSGKAAKAAKGSGKAAKAAKGSGKAAKAAKGSGKAAKVKSGKAAKVKSGKAAKVKSGKAAKCKCGKSTKAKKAKKGKSSAFAAGSMSKGAKVSLMSAGIAGVAAMVAMAAVLSNRKRSAAEPDESDPLLQAEEPKVELV